LSYSSFFVLRVSIADGWVYKLLIISEAIRSAEGRLEADFSVEALEVVAALADGGALAVQPIQPFHDPAQLRSGEFLVVLAVLVPDGLSLVQHEAERVSQRVPHR